MATDAGEARRILPFSPDAEQVLRFAGWIGAAKPLARAHLWRALSATTCRELPQARLSLDPGLAQTIDRAVEIAVAQAAGAVTRAHLLEALLEAEAASLGLNLAMLLFHRWRMRRGTGAAVPTSDRASTPS